MNYPGLAGMPDALVLAKQGDPQAIATLLNQSLNPNGIVVRVGLHGQCLGILLESTPVPDQDDMMSLIHRLFADLKPASINFVKVGGYPSGQNLPVWYEEIALENSLTRMEATYPAPSVASWLNQGMESGDSGAVPYPLFLPPVAPVGTGAGLVPTSGKPHGSVSPDERRFFRFYISDRETALLPLSTIQQVLRVPVVEILPVPHMPDCVLGIYNWRGEMLWLVDLAQQLGFPSPLLDLRAADVVNSIVIQVDHTLLGLAVWRTVDIETHAMQMLQPPTAGLFPAKLLTCMQGYFAASSSPVLNAKTLIHDSLLQVHLNVSGIA